MDSLPLSLYTVFVEVYTYLLLIKRIVKNWTKHLAKGAMAGCW